MKRVCLTLATVAVLFVETSRGADPKTPAFPDKLRPQAEAAQKAFAAGDYREAERVYEAMRKAAPDNVTVLSNLAVVQMRLELKKKAEETLRTALVLAPEDGFCRRMLGISLYSQQSYNDAAKELAKAVSIDPDDAEAHLYLAFCAAQAELSGTAEEEFAKAVKLNPDYRGNVPTTKLKEADRRWPVGDYLTPLERGRLRLPPARPIR